MRVRGWRAWPSEVQWGVHGKSDTRETDGPWKCRTLSSTLRSLEIILTAKKKKKKKPLKVFKLADDHARSPSQLSFLPVSTFPLNQLPSIFQQRWNLGPASHSWSNSTGRWKVTHASQWSQRKCHFFAYFLPWLGLFVPSQSKVTLEALRRRGDIESKVEERCGCPWRIVPGESGNSCPRVCSELEGGHRLSAQDGEPQTPPGETGEAAQTCQGPFLRVSAHWGTWGAGKLGSGGRATIEGSESHTV